MDSFFTIKYSVDRTHHECGPYSSLKIAIAALLKLIPKISSSQSKKKKFNYKAEIHECILQEDGFIQTIDIPFTENKCQRQKF